MSVATVRHILRSTAEFLAWLGGQPGYRKRIRMSEIAYLSLTTGEERQAQASLPKAYATVDEYRRALKGMPDRTDAERRDRALLALMVLTAARDTALVSLKLKHIDVEQNRIFQNAKEVRTKFRKSFETVFFPVGAEFVEVVRDWLTHLTDVRGFGPDDALFPKSAVAQNEVFEFCHGGLTREHWASAQPVRKICREAFARVGRPYVHPHTIRDTITQLAFALKLGPEELKAWSQNMGHDKPLTTLNSYGHVSRERQASIIAGLWHQKPSEASPEQDFVTRIVEGVAAKLKAG